jgi:hypothetical protein
MDVGDTQQACNIEFHATELRASQLVKKFPTFYGTRRFFTVLTTALH